MGVHCPINSIIVLVHRHRRETLTKKAEKSGIDF